MTLPVPALLSPVLLPPVLPGHAFGLRYGLPLPLAQFVVGGAAVVVLSFVLVRLRAPTASRPAIGTDGTAGTADVDVPPPRALRPLPAFASFTGLGLLVGCGLAGSDQVAENLLPTTFWLVLWIVVPLTCAVVGDWTRPLNPFANLVRALDRPAVRRAVLGREQPLRLPAAVGWWPAVALLLLLTCGELVVNLTATRPHVIAGGLVVYALVDAALGLLVGSAWLERGEVFSVLFATWGRLGVWRFGAAGRRGPGGGLDAPFERSTGRVAFVLLLLVGVTVDGVLATPLWGRVERGLGQREVQGLRTLVLLGVAAGVGLLFAAFAVASTRAAGLRSGPRDPLVGLLPSLLPIAFGYLLAHNAQYVMVNLQLLLPLVGNPLGLPGSNLHLPFPFNDTFEPSPTFLPAAFYWYVGLVAIVAAHVVAVVVAHRRLAAQGSSAGVDPALARRGEYPWLVAMVAYTVFSLVLIAQPLVQDAGPGPTQPVALHGP